VYNCEAELGELLQPLRAEAAVAAGTYPVMRFDVADIPERERRAALIGAIDECFYPCDTTLTAPQIRQGRLTMIDVGPVRAGRVVAEAMVVHRTPRLIRQRVGDFVFVPLPLREMVRLRQRGREVDVDRTRLGFTATADMYSYDQPNAFEMASLRIEADEVRMRVPTFENLTATGFSAEHGAGAMFVDYARSFCLNADRLDRQTGMIAVRHLLDLFALAVTCGDEAPGGAESAVREAHRQRILRHVEARLGDPALSTQSVSQALRLSDRYIQKLLAERALTLSGLIRDRRVAEAKRLLRDPTARSRSISTIAFQLGFADSAYFSRVFRDATGMAPRDYRAAELAAPQFLEATVVPGGEPAGGSAPVAGKAKTLTGEVHPEGRSVRGRGSH